MHSFQVEAVQKQNPITDIAKINIPALNATSTYHKIDITQSVIFVSAYDFGYPIQGQIVKIILQILVQ
jgi:predicted PP-loop superfamily ATPase